MNTLPRILSPLMAVLVLPSAWAQADHTAARSVVQIRGVDPQGKMFYGSGVVTGPGSVVTNCHVVRNGGKIAVFRGFEAFAVTGERADTLRDLCVLDTPGIGAPKASIGKASALKSGQTLSFYGYPRALGMSYSAGTVKSLHPFGGSRIIETSAFFTLGGSGGGLFDQRGKLVGLATFLAPGHAGAYFAIPADWIESVRQRKADGVAPLHGLSFWEEAARLPAFLKRPGH